MSHNPRIFIIECPSCKEHFFISDGWSISYREDVIWSDGEPVDVFSWTKPFNYTFSRCYCGNFIWLCRAKVIKEYEFIFWDEKSHKKFEKFRGVNHFPSEDDYLSAINSGFFRNVTEEMYLRITAWRETNHPIRANVKYDDDPEETGLLSQARRTEKKIELYKKIEQSKDEDEKKELRKQISVIDLEGYSRRPKKTQDNSLKLVRSELARQNMEIISEKLRNGREGEQLMRAEILRELECFDESIEILKIKKVRSYLPDFARKIRNLSQYRDPIVSMVKVNDLVSDPFYVSPGVLFPSIELAPTRSCFWQ